MLSVSCSMLVLRRSLHSAASSFLSSQCPSSLSSPWNTPLTPLLPLTFCCLVFNVWIVTLSTHQLCFPANKPSQCYVQNVQNGSYHPDCILIRALQSREAHSAPCTQHCPSRSGGWSLISIQHGSYLSVSLPTSRLSKKGPGVSQKHKEGTGGENLEKREGNQGVLTLWTTGGFWKHAEHASQN